MDLKLSHRFVSTPAAIGLAVMAWFGSPSVAHAANPNLVTVTTQPSAGTIDIQKVSAELQKVLPNGVSSTAAERAVAAPQAIPLIKQIKAYFDQVSIDNNTVGKSPALDQNFDAQLYSMGDKETVDRVDASIKSSVDADSVSGQTIKLWAQWMSAPAEAAAQQPIAEQLEKLDHAHPADNGLTSLTYTLAGNAASPDLQTHLKEVANSMTSPMAKQYSNYAQVKKLAADKLSKALGKQMTLTATTVEGESFSSDTYKGKVILVDFWATWCAPCKAELPRVKAMYAKYHDKGLEVIGVSNDHSGEALKKFTPANDMPWVELFDPAAAKEHAWHPITVENGIDGIPVMFLIDKKGICRSVTARENFEEMIPKLLAE